MTEKMTTEKLTQIATELTAKTGLNGAILYNNLVSYYAGGCVLLDAMDMNFKIIMNTIKRALDPQELKEVAKIAYYSTKINIADFKDLETLAVYVDMVNDEIEARNA